MSPNQSELRMIIFPIFLNFLCPRKDEKCPNWDNRPLRDSEYNFKHNNNNNNNNNSSNNSSNTVIITTTTTTTIVAATTKPQEILLDWRNGNTHNNLNNQILQTILCNSCAFNGDRVTMLCKKTRSCGWKKRGDHGTCFTAVGWMHVYNLTACSPKTTCSHCRSATPSKQLLSKMQ